MKKSILIFFTGLLVLGLFVGGVSAMGGSGTQSNPWTINSLTDLKMLSGVGYSSYAGTDKYFALTSDIVNDGSFTSIGSSSYPFNGHFDGRNHTIYYLTQSVFYTFQGEIKNTNFDSAIIAQTQNTGFLSLDKGYGTVTNCNFNNIYMYYGVGGYTIKSAIVFGYVSGGAVSISNCTVRNCTINSNALYSPASGASVSAAFIAWSVASQVPTINSSTVMNCTFLNGDRCFGFSHTGNLIDCNLINVNMYGGRNGELEWGMNITTTRCVASGTTHNSGVIFRILSGASLTNNTSQSSPKNIGELVTFTASGQQGAAVYKSGNIVKSGYVFNYGTGGTQVGNNPFTASYSSGGTKNVTLTLTGWNGSSTVSGGTLTTTAYIKIPYTPTLHGSGTSSDPYQIGSNANLQEWGEHADYYNNMYMIIIADFVPATTVSAFAGNLAGGNHTLTNARLPLFNTLGGTVNNLKFTNSIVSGNGILANTSSAAVSNVTVDDCFVGGSTTGGLVGNATGSFTDCTVNHITVKGSSTAGGIAGAGNTTVTRCKVLNSDLLAPTTYGVCA